MAVTVTVSIRAANGVDRTHEYYFADNAAIADINTEMAAHLADLDAAIDGQIVGGNVIFPLALPGGLKAAPLATASHEVDVRAIFTSGGNFTTTKTITTVSADEINLATNPPSVVGGGSVEAWANGLVSGAGATDNTDSRSADITSLKSLRVPQ